MSQIALPLKFRPAMGRDAFIVAPANEEAVAWLDAWPNWPNRMLILIGPEGCGKSHLASVYARRSGAEIVDARGLDFKSFTTSDNLHLAVEDAPVPSALEEQLFHLINWVREREGTLLLTSRHTPAEWRIALPDLRSRLRAATQVRVERPDEALLAAMMVKMLNDRQIEAKPQVIDFALSRVERSFSAVEALVEAVDRRSLAQKRMVTIPLMREVIETHAAENSQ